MIKHIGQHKGKKVVVLYRTVPGEDHMCLVAYSDSLPNLVHEEVMACVESNAGQTADPFADALFRITMKDGRNALGALHSEKLIKKIPTNQVLLTPVPGTQVALGEINKIIDQIKSGEEGKKKMDDLKKTSVEETVVEAAALSDEDLARQRREQSARMRKQAAELLKEAEALEKEAESFVSNAVPNKENNATTTKKGAAANARKKASTVKI